MSCRLARGALLVGLLAVTPHAAQAQNATDLRGRVALELFTFGDCGVPLCLDLTNAHGEHFVPGLQTGNQAVIAFLTQSIGEATQRFPLSATSSGATSARPSSDAAP